MAAESGHAEFTVTVRDRVPNFAYVFTVLNTVRDLVQAGKWIEPRNAIRFGCRRLRVVAREDGTLGLEETVAPDVWAEQIDRTITETHYQAVACDALALPQSWGSITESDHALMSACAPTAERLAFARIASDKRGFSGWGVMCRDQHEHEKPVVRSFAQLKAEFPYLSQFLGVPAGINIVVRRPSRPTDSVVPKVMRDGANLNASGRRFGPDSAVRTATRARNALFTDGQGLIWTTVGKKAGLPDIAARTVLMAPPTAPASGWAALVLDDLQDAIAQGTWYEPGMLVRSGWRTLRIIDRADGMLGLEERTGADRWAEQIDLTLHELWSQRQLLAGLGIEEWISFPRDSEDATVADCVDDGVTSVLFAREPTDSPTHSGWSLSCVRQHEHGSTQVRSLGELVAARPYLARFLALPTPVEVRINASRGEGAIRAGVRMFGGEFLPESGSPAAELLGRAG